jgi:hypothetical protein
MKKMADKIYEDTTTVAPDGRISVKLPFKKDAAQLGSSRAQALKRPMNLHQKFCLNHNLSENYKAAFQEMIDEGFMELVPEDQLTTDPGKGYYIPHHCVIKDSSTTTKLRIVFDGSAKTSSGQSINDILLVGPTLQENLYNIMIRFRWHIVAVSGDITKMYLQVELAPEDRDFHRILWFDKNGKLLTYRMTRVTFGLGPSSHLSIKSLLKACNLATSETSRKAICRDLYVDDFLSGAETVEEAQKLQKEVTTALAGYAFPIARPSLTTCLGLSARTWRLLNSVPATM